MIVGIGLDIVATANVRGVTRVHVTLTHSAGVAAAAVILEGGG